MEQEASAQGSGQKNIDFVSQSDEAFKSLFPESNYTGLCFSASLSMCISAFAKDKAQTQSIVGSFFKEAKSINAISEDGGFTYSKLQEAIGIVSNLLEGMQLPVDVSVMEHNGPDDIIDQLDRGNILIFQGLEIGEDEDSESSEGHAMVMDKLFISPDGEEIAIGFLDPSESSRIQGRRFITPEQLVYNQNETPYKIDNRLIVFSPKQKLA